MRKAKLLAQLVEAGVVAVIRSDSPEEAILCSEQAIAGGIKAIELTMTTPFVLEAVTALSKRYSSDADPSGPDYAIIGVGTVLDAETAGAAIRAGAEFVVAPCLNRETITFCNRYAVPVMPGVITISDIQSALELGVDIVKLFPGNLFSPSIISAIKGPLPQANLMPTGGVSLDNLGAWIRAGAIAVGIGSDLTKDAVKTKDYSLVARKASAYMSEYRKAVEARDSK